MRYGEPFSKFPLGFKLVQSPISYIRDIKTNDDYFLNKTLVICPGNKSIPKADLIR
jgi:hypothetical protein